MEVVYLHLTIASKVCELFQLNMNLLPKKWLSKDTSWMNDNLRLKIVEVLNYFMVVGLDKAPNNPSFICKKLAFLVARGRLSIVWADFGPIY